MTGNARWSRPAGRFALSPRGQRRDPTCDPKEPQVPIVACRKPRSPEFSWGPCRDKARRDRDLWCLLAELYATVTPLYPRPVGIGPTRARQRIGPRRWSVSGDSWVTCRRGREWPKLFQFMRDGEFWQQPVKLLIRLDSVHRRLRRILGTKPGRCLIEL